MIIGSILLIIALILSLRIKLIITFKDSLSVCLGVLFFRIRLFPIKFKKRKKKGPFRMSAKQAAKIREKVRLREERKQLRRIERAKAKAEKKKKELEKKQQGETQSSGKLDVAALIDILGTVRSLVTDVLSVSLSHFRLDLARLHVTVATEDAATTAIAYGAVCAALDSLLCALEPLKGFNAPKTKYLSVSYDFLSEQTKLDLKLVMSMRVWHGLHMGFVALKRIASALFQRLVSSAQEKIPNAKQ